MKAFALLAGAALVASGCTEPQKNSPTSNIAVRTSDSRDPPTGQGPTEELEAGRAGAMQNGTVRPSVDEVAATDNGMSAAETAITAAIRKAIMSDSALSFSAKNATVITVGTKVTLRGGVPTELERTSLGALATATPGVTEVDNQLEVNP